MIIIVIITIKVKERTFFLLLRIPNRAKYQQNINTLSTKLDEPGDESLKGTFVLGLCRVNTFPLTGECKKSWHSTMKLPTSLSVASNRDVTVPKCNSVHFNPLSHQLTKHAKTTRSIPLCSINNTAATKMLSNWHSCFHNSSTGTDNSG